MKKLLLSLFSSAAVLAAVILMWQPHTAHAAFNGNNLMDDGIFTSYNSMSAAQIDSWLNSNFPNSCISTNHGFAAPDPTGYSPGGGFTYGGNVSAGQVIYDAAQAYGINPQVLLVTLQKEESLVSGDAGCSTLRYTAAMGYGCPDGGTTHDYSGLNLYTLNGNTVTSVSGTCVNGSSKAGFSQQVIRAAWLLMFGEQRSKGNTGWAVIKGNWDNSDDPPTCYGGPMTQGTFKRCSSDSSAVFYDGYTTIDGASTHMDTGATAALYWYTPHFAGNQNFDNLFQGWFGTIYTPSYSWQLLSVSYSTNANVFAAGQNGTVTVTVKNTGSAPWYNQDHGGNPVRLGTWQPQRSSPLYSAGWLSPTRPANMTEGIVQPGENATFVFNVNVNNLGTYVEGLNLVLEGILWMPSVGLSPTISIVNGYQWQINSVSYGNGTGYMSPGTSQTITVRALNTGLLTWSNSSGPPIRMATWPPQRQSSVANGWLNPTRAVNMTEASVAPGQVGTFTFPVYMPDSLSHYERLNLVAEGQNWFNDNGLTLYLQGLTYAWQPVWYSPSTGNWSIARNTTFTITIRARNTGNITWTKNGSFPVHLGTDPPGRGTALETSGWINSIRPTGLVEDSVAPGQEGTLTFQAKTPNVTGMRFEAFNLVAEGVLWFQDPGFAMYVNVL